MMNSHGRDQRFFSANASIKLLVVAGMWASLACSGSVSAREWLGLTGLESGSRHDTYAFVGAVAPLAPDATLGKGWVQRYWLDWLEYRFDSNSEEVRARAPGASAMLGYQASDPLGFVAAYAGLGYRNTKLKPDQPDAETRGGQTALQLLGEVDHRITSDCRLTGAVQLSLGPDSYWTRIKFLNKPSTVAFWHGVEVVFQGDPDYRTFKAGFVLDEWGVGRGLAANFKLGASRTKGLKTGAYAGIELVGSFGAQ
jgi:hypothetical protein